MWWCRYNSFIHLSSGQPNGIRKWCSIRRDNNQSFNPVARSGELVAQHHHKTELICFWRRRWIYEPSRGWMTADSKLIVKGLHTVRSSSSCSPQSSLVGRPLCVVKRNKFIDHLRNDGRTIWPSSFVADRMTKVTMKSSTKQQQTIYSPFDSPFSSHMEKIAPQLL